MILTDVSWLAGIIDGEGCFSLRSNGRGVGFSASFFLENSSEALIDKAERVLRELGLNPRRETIRPANRHIHSRKPMHRLYMHRDVHVALRAILPYLASEKREYAFALLELEEMRSVSGAYYRWTEEQVAFAKTIRQQFMPRSVTK